MLVDPLAEVVALLQPAADFSKHVECAGFWRVHHRGNGAPFYCAVLKGCCRMAVDGHGPITLLEGDFVLVPAMRDLVSGSDDLAANAPEMMPRQIGPGHYRFGNAEEPADPHIRIGHCRFAAPDAGLLVPLLPQVMLVRGQHRLVTLIDLVADETAAHRPARELVLQRLLEVLLIEALRCSTGAAGVAGLARGLADHRVAIALRAIHARPGHRWTIAALAAEAAMSRSAFFTRFQRMVGVAPMEYLLAWRMALAKRLLRERDLAVEHVAERVGYGSASTFSVAFARHTGMPPARYGRMLPSIDQGGAALQ